MKAGKDFSLFLLKDGSVYGCGANNQGQLADISYNNSETSRSNIHSCRINSESHFGMNSSDSSSTLMNETIVCYP